MPFKGKELRSEITAAGELKLSLADVETPDPKGDEIVVRVEATPINPSDLGLLLGPADIATLEASGGGLTAKVPEQRMGVVAARVGQSMPVGNEGAGVVVAAGPDAQHLMGKLVTMIGGAMYAQHRLIRASEVMVLPEGASAKDGASCFVNPLTALGFVETLKREGHKALVHTAAASNLGQMLVKICLKDGVPLVNVVRSAEQAKILTDIGATHVLDSTQPDFREKLVEAIAETGATLAFDAVGGGKLGGQILAAMETAANRGAAYSRYGSNTFKQLYIYGALDLSPTVLERNYGFSWALGGWLLTPFLMKIGPEAAQGLRNRVMAELKTTFASHYTAEISLAEALQPDVLRAYARRATGEKYLINPAKA